MKSPANQNTSGMLRGPLAWMAGNSVAANLLMLLFLVGGLIAGVRIKQEVFPDFELDKVMVTVPYPGASPEEVEQGIILAIEEAVRGLDGVEEVTASAREGVGSVEIDLLLGADPQKTFQDIQNEIDRIVTFPEEAEEPQVVLLSRRRQVISTVIYGDLSENVLRAIGEDVRERLLQDPGITQAELSGVRPYEISIEIPQHKLRMYDLTLGEVAARLRNSALELPGGGIKTRGGEILLRVTERRDYGREFATIPIVSLPDGSEVLLGEIATIEDGFRDIDNYATFNGQPALRLEVFRVGDQTPIEVADRVRELVAELKQSLPPGVGITTWTDFSQIYRERMELLLRNGAIGLVLVLVLLGIFLESRLAFWVTMGIPISFLGSLLVLPFIGITINMISLFAFIVSLGIVVDDAIVVGENIFTYHSRGMKFPEAAIRGVREVALPVTFSVLTNIAAFTPLLLIPGFTGKIFRVIPCVVISVFSISLIESLFILPAHLGHLKDKRRHGFSGWLHGRQQAFSQWFSGWVENRYGPFLGTVLRHRYLAVALGLAVLILAIGYVRSGRLGMTLFPRVESDYAYATAVLPYGTAVERTTAVQETLLESAREVIRRHGGEKLAVGIYAEIGGSGGGHISEVSVLLTRPEQRPISTSRFVDLWREASGDIPGIESMRFQADRGGPGSGADLSIELSHRNLAILEQASADLAEELSQYPATRDVDDGFSPGKQQLDFKITPQGESMGLTAADIARQVRHAFYGAEVLRQQRGRNELRVMVRLPETARETEQSVEELMIRTPDGREIPLREAATTVRGRAYTSIDRRKGRRVVTVTADVQPRSQAAQLQAAIEAEVFPRLEQRYPRLSHAYRGRQEDIAESMRGLKAGFAVAMLLVYAMLAVPFRSYLQPAIIMVSIPFGIVGAVLGHILMGYSLSVMSMFGIVALSGVVVNDSLVLIDFANREHREGQSALQAINSAGIRRFRPIMLTTLTTFGGLAPMIFETSRQARFLIPMAISLGYGILFATLITLVLVPSLYLIANDVRKESRRAWRWIWG